MNPSLRPHILIIAILFALVSNSCDDNDGSNNLSTGTLSLTVEIDSKLHLPNGETTEIPSGTEADPGDATVSLSSDFADYMHTWDSFSLMPPSQRLLTGTYTIKGSWGNVREGFDSPFYEAEIKTDIKDGENTDVLLKLSLAHSAVHVSFDDKVTDYFTTIKAFLHSEGGGYFEYTSDQKSLLYLNPGPTILSLQISLPDGRSAGVNAFMVENAAKGFLYDYNIDLEFNNQTPVIVVRLGSEIKKITLTEEFLATAPPHITPSGWNPENILSLIEGDTPTTPLRALVSSASELQSLVLSTNSPSLALQGFPKEVNLLNLSDKSQQEVSDMGLDWEKTPDGIMVDLTSLLGHLTFLNPHESISTFGLCATDIEGRVGEPLMLTVETSNVEIKVIETPDAVVGATETSVIVEAPVESFNRNVAIKIMATNNTYQQAEIKEIHNLSNKLYQVIFEIQESNTPLQARLIYCGIERAEFKIRRKMPEFTLRLDPFSTYAVIKVIAEEPAMIKTISKWLTPYIGDSPAMVLNRDEDSGILTVSGLNAQTAYSLKATLLAKPAADDFTPAINFVTEGMRALPNEDFENRTAGPFYKELPSGGRFSQTTVAIHNWQNHENIDMEVPASWANTNSKTFCNTSKTHNTWYMQPSVFTETSYFYSGNFSVNISSVGFDPEGAEIPDYTQTGEPYLTYSPIVPEVRYKAAGKLFLGAYSFNHSSMIETYDDIVSWDCRPVSLNGYYKYRPSSDYPSDYGLALIEVYGIIDGERKIIASGSAQLTAINSFSPFTAQLEYKYFGVKATGLRVMFASTSSIGTITHESLNVPTSTDVEHASIIGSTLTLDHVNLSY